MPKKVLKPAQDYNALFFMKAGKERESTILGRHKDHAVKMSRYKMGSRLMARAAQRLECAVVGLNGERVKYGDDCAAGLLRVQLGTEAKNSKVLVNDQCTVDRTQLPGPL